MNKTIAILAALVLTLAACGKKDAPPPPPKTTAPTSSLPAPAAGVTVSAVTLGNGIGPQKQVVNASNTFARNDTIYASVDTTGTGNATLNAKWTYRANGQDVPVREDAQTVNLTGPATSEFHISKPDGWPAGEYKVEISTTGNPPAARTFTVK